MKHDLIHVQGKPYVLVPLHEYRAMVAPGSESIGSGESLPQDILDRLYAGQENPIRVLRKFRGLTQAELAKSAGLSRPYLTELEIGNKEGSITALKNLASALDTPLSLLLSQKS